MRLVSAAVVWALAGSACSIQDGPNRSAAPSTVSPDEASEAVVPVEDPPVVGSVGLVTVDDVAYSLDFDCYAPGAGEILAVGTGIDPGTNSRVEAYVQAFLGAPYLAIEVVDVGGGVVLYEASLERVLEYSVADDVLRADDVALVTDLDLDTRTATPAGVGSVVVECREYFDELPDGFAAG